MDIRTSMAPVWAQIEIDDERRFEIGRAIAEDALELNGYFRRVRSIDEIPVARRMYFVRKYVRNWQGVKDSATGQPCSFSAANLELLDADTLDALVAQIQMVARLGVAAEPPKSEDDGAIDPDATDAFLSGDEAGNSDSQ